MASKEIEREEIAGFALKGSDDLTELLRQRTRQLLQKLDEGDILGANQLIQDINNARDETLYLEIGRLTRGLHNAIKNFHLEIGLNGHSKVKNEISEISDATSRLHYVINLTEEAANTTMDMVEEGAPLVLGLAEQASELKADWAMFRQHHMDCDVDDENMYNRIDVMLTRTVNDASSLHHRLNEILMAQGYQDLSGQVIKRVIALVSDVEQSLVRLVRLASNVEAVAGVVPKLGEITASEGSESALRAEGPQMKNSKSDVVSGQDDVDALLSSLGF